MCDSREGISFLHSRSIELDCSCSCRVKRRLNQKNESIEIQTICENGLPQAFQWSVHGATVTRYHMLLVPVTKLNYFEFPMAFILLLLRAYVTRFFFCSIFVAVSSAVVSTLMN